MAKWAALASLAVVSICAAIPVSAAVPITPTVVITLASVRVVARPVVVTIPVVPVPVVPVPVVPVLIVAVPVVAVPVVTVPIGTSTTLTLITIWDTAATDTSDATARAGRRIGLEFEELLADTLPCLVLLSRLQIGEARLVISRGVDEARDLVYELPLGLFRLCAPLKLLQLRL